MLSEGYGTQVYHILHLMTFWKVYVKKFQSSIDLKNKKEKLISLRNDFWFFSNNLKQFDWQNNISFHPKEYPIYDI